MTAYARPRVTHRPHLPPLGEGALDGVRGSLRQWRMAFQVAGSSASRRDADLGDVLLLGRD